MSDLEVKLKTAAKASCLRVAQEIEPLLNAEVERRLTNDYLGVATGATREASGVSNVTEDGFRLGTTYAGYFYEKIGNGVPAEKPSPEYYRRYSQLRRQGLLKGASPKWRGTGRRPFLKDSLFAILPKVREMIGRQS